MDAAEEFCPVELHHIPLFCSRVGMPTQYIVTPAIFSTSSTALQMDFFHLLFLKPI